MRVVGLDLSLTSTGIALIKDGQAAVTRCQPGKRTGHDRMDYILGSVQIMCGAADLVVLEAPVIYSGHKGGAIDGIGLNWLIRHVVLHAQHLPCALVLPQHLKQYATSAGGGARAGKDQVLLQADRRYRHLVQVAGNDEADALILAAMGADHLGCPLAAEVPKANRLALDKVTWPD